MSSEGKLAGKKALVTGAGTGIGREIALEFAREGADVVLHYSRSDAGAKSAVEEIQKMGRKATAIHANFNDVNDVVALATKAIELLGQVDCLVNNAGITFNKPFFDVTVEQFETLYDVNIRAQFFLTQKIAQDMVKHGGGTVVNLTSIHGVSGAREHSVYAGTKGAIIAYTRALAVELGYQGVRVNAIAPGWVNVENYYTVMPGFDLEQAAKDAFNVVPVTRAGAPIDIAKVAVFLSHEDSGYILGQTIIVDGGSTSLMSLMTDFRTESKATFEKEYDVFRADSGVSDHRGRRSIHGKWRVAVQADAHVPVRALVLHQHPLRIGLPALGDHAARVPGCPRRDEVRLGDELAGHPIRQLPLDAVGCGKRPVRAVLRSDRRRTDRFHPDRNRRLRRRRDPALASKRRDGQVR
jgi:NAD(P)-dependent dehydrogenase (short-subunit alcohol dehydrogenase family)